MSQRTIEKVLLCALGAIVVVVFARAMYRDYRWNTRCEAAGGIPVATTACVRPGSFIEVPR